VRVLENALLFVVPRAVGAHECRHDRADDIEIVRRYGGDRLFRDRPCFTFPVGAGGAPTDAKIRSRAVVSTWSIAAIFDPRAFSRSGSMTVSKNCWIS
jgi:hypothetical protein